MAHQKTPGRIDPDHGRTGRAPSAKLVSVPIVRAYNYLRDWCYPHLTTCFSGPRDASNGYNPLTGADFYCTFYIIHCSPPRADARDRIVNVAVLLHELDTTGGALQTTIDWHPVASGAGTQIFAAYHASGYAPTDTDGRAPHNNLVRVTRSCSYTPDAGGDCVLSKIVITNGQAAALSVWESPLSATTAAQFTNAENSGFSTIRGYISTLTKSLGAMVHMIGDGSDDIESIERLTRRTLIGWAHPAGVWCYDDAGRTPAGTWTDLFRSAGYAEARLLTKTRTFSRATGTRFLRPALVITSDDAPPGGTAGGVRFLSSTGDTWDYYVPAGGLANPTLVEYGDGTGATGAGVAAGTYVRPQVMAPSSGELVVYSLSLFEGSDY